MENKHINYLNSLLKQLQNAKSTELRRQLKSDIFWYIERSINPEEGCEVISKWLLPVLLQPHLQPLEDHQLTLIAWIRKILEANKNVDNSLFTLFLMLIPKLKTSAAIMWFFSSPIILETVSTGSKEYALSVMQCFDVTLTKMLKRNEFPSEEDNAFQALTKMLLQLHYRQQPVANDIVTNGIFVLSSFRVLSKLCILDSKLALKYVSELLGLSNAYFLYGLTNTTTIMPRKVLPSQQAVAMDTAEEAAATTAAKGAQARNNGGLLQKKRKPKAVQRHINVTQQISVDQQELLQLLEQSFSDSELSGAEQAIVTQQQRQLSAKVRLAAISLLGVVLHAQERRHIYGYWHVLFPTQTGEQARSDLLYISQHDPNVRCRSNALQITARLIFEAKALLAQAEIGSDSTHMATTAFMPFSQHLGMLLIATYDALCKILAKEAAYAVLAQALKSLALLVQATPFKRIKSNVHLVANFVQHVRPLVYHRNDNVQLAALMVMEFLLLVPELTTEITAAIGYKTCLANETVAIQATTVVEEEEEAEFEIEEDIATTTTAMSEKCTIVYKNTSWLLLRILANAERNCANPLLVQCYKVLNAMSTHFELLLPQLQRLTELFARVFSKEVDDKTIHVAHCLNSCTHHMNLWLSLQTHTSCYEAILNKCMSFWLQLLPVILNALRDMQEQHFEEYVMLMNALSNIGPIVYEKLTRATQMQLLSLLTNYGSLSSTDTEVNIAAAAIRALAIYATYPALRADFVFIENTVELALALVKSKSVLTRSKSFWALSSISDALILQESTQCLSEHLFRRYLDVAVEGTKETNDKINCSAVHILGNLLSLLQAKQLAEKRWQVVLHTACKRISTLTCTGNSKTRWNACYALSIMWRNKLLFCADLLSYQFEIYANLCAVITNHQNFKVRINASSALQQISARAHYGAHFETVWAALLCALEQSHNLENFYEYNHRDKLQEQLCLSICQLLKLAEPEDFPGMRQRLTERLEVVHNTWLRVTNRLVPELAAPLMSCSTIILQKITAQTSNILKNAIEFVAQAFNTNSNNDE